MKSLLFVSLLLLASCQSAPVSNVSYSNRNVNNEKPRCLTVEQFEKEVSYSNRPTICQK